MKRGARKLALVMGAADPDLLRLPELPDAASEDAGSESALTVSRLYPGGPGEAQSVASALRLGKATRFMPVDRDYVFLLNAYNIEPGSSVPRPSTMTDFNFWTLNSRVFPGIDPLVAPGPANVSAT